VQLLSDIPKLRDITEPVNDPPTCLEWGFDYLQMKARFGLPVRRAERSGSAAERLANALQVSRNERERRKERW
jgi:hypothetical protein